jgi:hypothetical protein
MAKPSTLPRWAETSGGTPSSNIDEPSSGRKDIGWLDDERPPAWWLNWWKNTVYQWIKYLDQIHTEAFTWTALHVFEKKVTVVAGLATNDPGVDATGDGSGPGILGTGGATAGAPGVVGEGGIGGGPGVQGTGIGTGLGVYGAGGNSGTAAAGVKGQGGSGGSPGVDGTGGGAGAGVRGTGGASGAPGVDGTGTVNNPGVKGTGQGGAPGVQGIGGSGDATGGMFTGGGTNGNGVSGIAQGNGTGVSGSGGGTGGSFSGSIRGASITNGIQFNGAQPDIDDDPGGGQNNYLCATNVCKAWALIETDGSGGVTVADGYNIDTANVTVTVTHILVTIKRPMANVDYGVGATNQTTLFREFSVDHSTNTTTEFRVLCRDSTAALIDPTGNALKVFVEVKGRQ